MLAENVVNNPTPLVRQRHEEAAMLDLRESGKRVPRLDGLANLLRVSQRNALFLQGLASLLEILGTVVQDRLIEHPAGTLPGRGVAADLGTQGQAAFLEGAVVGTSHQNAAFRSSGSSVR
jgi:hypothetical protein